MHAWQWCKPPRRSFAVGRADLPVMLIEGALSIAVAIGAYFLLPNWGEFHPPCNNLCLANMIQQTTHPGSLPKRLKWLNTDWSSLPEVTTKPKAR